MNWMKPGYGQFRVKLMGGLLTRLVVEDGGKTDRTERRETTSQVKQDKVRPSWYREVKEGTGI